LLESFASVLAVLLNAVLPAVAALAILEAIQSRQWGWFAGLLVAASVVVLGLPLYYELSADGTLRLPFDLVLAIDGVALYVPFALPLVVLVFVLVVALRQRAPQPAVPANVYRLIR
jgi:hypothetical protein